MSLTPKSDYYVTNNIILLKHKEKRLKKEKQSNLLRQMRHDFICCLRLYTHSHELGLNFSYILLLFYFITLFSPDMKLIINI